ncbi:MAG: thiamine biosynthesis protein ThiF [Thermoleophilia bacterium]|nr:thiamine biosynthesis protein ThiF [Thermoleophilia bacterium]
MTGDRADLSTMFDRSFDLDTSASAARTPLVPCPSTEVVLLDDGRLLFVPVRGREQLQVDAPWGRAVHAVVVEGRPAPASFDAEQHEVLDATIRSLAASGVLIPASRVAAADVARYDRQVRWFAQEGADGPTVQRRLAAATVLMIGVGGFGAAMAEMLCRAGVGTLVLLDDDHVDEVNLPRQMLYDCSDVGSRKSAAAAQHLELLNPEAEIVPVFGTIESSTDVAKLVRKYRPQLVVCAADRPPIAVKGWIDDGAFALGVPVLHGGSRPPYAYVGPLLVPGVTSCYSCFLSSRTQPGAEALEAEVNVVRNLRPPTLPSSGWCDIGAASLACGQAVAQLTGLHEPAILGRELELDSRTLATEWMEPLQGHRVCSCEACIAA